MKENKLIAEFWGMELGDDKTMYYDDAENLHPPTPINELKFHSSWDWLMPVVREVLTIVNINLVNYCVDELKFCVLDNDIDGAFEEVVEFINYLKKTNNN